MILLGTRVRILPDNSDEVKTKGGIIIPDQAKVNNNHLKSGIVNLKGTGTPWNPMDDIHLKQRVMYKRGSGMPYEEEHDGHTVNYLILEYNELLFV